MKYRVETRGRAASKATVERGAARHPFGEFVHRTRGSGTLFGIVLCCVFLPAVLTGAAKATSNTEPGIDELKTKLSSAKVSDKVHLCVQIAEKQLDQAGKLYEGGQVETAQPLLTDVVTFSELARDYSLQSNKHQKQTEISVRMMTRRLKDLLHVVGHDDQGPVREAIGRLEHVRDDLLMSMFPKGMK